MTISSLQSIEHRAFREAGHAVMSFLIRKGYTDRFVPFDRSLILTPFEFVAIEGSRANWHELTYSLGSLATTAQVLTAGYLAERIQFQIVEPAFPPNDSVVQTALHLIGAYIEEYGGDTMTMEDRDSQALKLFGEIFDYVDEWLHSYWVCVDTLAKHLLDAKILSEQSVFATIEQSIPEDKRLSRDVETILERPAPQASPPMSARKRWWQFWKQ